MSFLNSNYLLLNEAKWQMQLTFIVVTKNVINSKLSMVITAQTDL